MVTRDALWYSVANPEKNASDPVSKTAAAAAASKTWLAKLPSGVSLLYPKQYIAMETVPSDHPVVFHEFFLQGGVSIRKTVFPGMAIPMLKIRRPNGRLIFNMEIAIRR